MATFYDFSEPWTDSTERQRHQTAESKALRALFIFINTNAHTEVLGMELKASNILE